MKIFKTKIDPEGYINLWGPALAALAVFLLLAFVFATISSNAIEQDIQKNIDKKFQDQQLPPVYVPKLTPKAQEAIDKIETDRELSHVYVDHMHDSEVQCVLDTMFNFR